MLRRTRVMVVLAAIAAVGVTPIAVASASSAGSSSGSSSATAAAAPYCGITWGSLARTAGATTMPQLTNVRAGRHDCYDRLVLDVRGGAGTGYWVNYVTNVTADGSGHVVPVRGGAKLSIIAQAPSYDQDGVPTYTFANHKELVNVSGYRTFRQVAWAGSFEGNTTVGLGVRARLPFRVFTLPGKLVIDVAHAW
jgi:hypothetical protein